MLNGYRYCAATVALNVNLSRRELQSGQRKLVLGQVHVKPAGRPKGLKPPVSGEL